MNSDIHYDKDGINKCVSEFEDILFDVAKNSLKIKKKKHRPKLSNKANKIWFDTECEFKRRQLRKLANQKHKDPGNVRLRDAYHNTEK